MNSRFKSKCWDALTLGLYLLRRDRLRADALALELLLAYLPEQRHFYGPSKQRFLISLFCAGLQLLLRSPLVQTFWFSPDLVFASLSSHPCLYALQPFLLRLCDLCLVSEVTVSGSLLDLQVLLRLTRRMELPPFLTQALTIKLNFPVQSLHR